MAVEVVGGQGCSRRRWAVITRWHASGVRDEGAARKRRELGSYRLSRMAYTGAGCLFRARHPVCLLLLQVPINNKLCSDNGEAYSSTMSTNVEPSTAAPTLPSVFDATPEVLGGIPARQGFAYQDDVAAGFYIQMLLRGDLIEVACETYDDIRLVWQRDVEKIIEFVQVKAEHPNQLWSVAKLCERQKSPTKPDGFGSSILEKSLGQDKFLESSWFRIVTCRQTNSDLELLETRERGHEHRSATFPQFKTLIEDVGKRLDGVKSIKGDDTAYWLINACWDVIPERNIEHLNQQSLTTALHGLGPWCPRLTGSSVRSMLCSSSRRKSGAATSVVSPLPVSRRYRQRSSPPQSADLAVATRKCSLIFGRCPPDR